MKRRRQRRLLCRLPTLPPLLLLLLLLPTGRALPMQAVSATTQRRLKGVPMNGNCAVVSHHDSWEDDATVMVRFALPNCPIAWQSWRLPSRRPPLAQPMWSYRVKASPWMVFGIVKWYVKPVNVAVADVYAATLLSNVVIGRGQEVRANGRGVRALPATL